jgi:sigma-B regulation protein RsbU (phosphoserine phosphatase)
LSYALGIVLGSLALATVAFGPQRIAKGDFFGQDALSAVLRQTAELAPSAASDRIIAAVQQWSASQDDDLTVLICDYIPSA